MTNAQQIIGNAEKVAGVTVTGAPRIHDDVTGLDLNALDLGEIVKTPGGQLLAVFGDSFTDGPGRGVHYPSVAVEVTIDPNTGQISYGKVKFTLPAGTIVLNGKTYMMVAATSAGCNGNNLPGIPAATPVPTPDSGGHINGISTAPGYGSMAYQPAIGFRPQSCCRRFIRSPSTV
ncbi:MULTISPECIES: hypothetical protein [Mycobacterium]|uniref:hypothetical protein n=1 Tax=Mycobacterium TaxID=1763 RepID=UPI001EF153D6|nr:MULTISPECIES: hypothetical protein [Mycobacterium]